MKVFASLLLFTAHFDKYPSSLSLLEIRPFPSYSSSPGPCLFCSHEKLGRFLDSLEYLAALKTFNEA